MSDSCIGRSSSLPSSSQLNFLPALCSSPIIHLYHLNLFINHAVVVGAGCVGLTTAVRLLEAGFPVLVIAEHLPSDPLTARYSSTAAGAHHLSFADNKDWRQRFLDQRTFDVFWNESTDPQVANKRGILRLTQTEYYVGDEKHIRFLEQLPDVS